jgi:hypothetical protein
MAVPRSRSRPGLDEGKQSGLTRILVWISVDVDGLTRSTHDRGTAGFGAFETLAPPRENAC